MNKIDLKNRNAVITGGAQGIGLANVKFNIEKINGAVTVISNLNSGTTLTLYFPLINNVNHEL